jgi:hypothetical protein
MTTRILPALAGLLIFSTAASAAETRCALVMGDSVTKHAIFGADYLKLGGALGADGCPPDIAHKGVTWLPAPEASAPDYDDATQVLEGPTTTIGKDQVTTSYTVRDKTAAELDAAKEDRLNSVDTFILKTLCDHESRMRVLEGKSAITLTQCRAAIKAALQ